MIDPVEVVWDKIKRIHPSLEDFHDCGDTGRLYIDCIDLNYDTTIPSVTPVAIQSSVYDNQTSVQNTQHFIVQRETTNSFTFTLSEGIKAGANFKAKLPFAGESEVNVEVEISSTQAWTVETKRSWQYEAEVPIPPRTKIEVIFSVLEGKLETPYILTANVRGGFTFSENGRRYVTNVDHCLTTGYLGLGDPRIFQVVVPGTFHGVDATKYVVTARELDTGNERILESGHIDPVHGLLMSDVPSVSYELV